MKKFTYTINKIRTAEDADRISAALLSISDIERVSVSIDESRIYFEAEPARFDSDSEKNMVTLLANMGYEVLLPEGVNTYIPASSIQSTKPSKMVTLASAVWTSIAVGLVCIMLTLSLIVTGVIGGRGKTPDYINNVISLDEFFREVSFEGVDEEMLGEYLLRAYAAYSGDVYAQYFTPEELDALMSEMGGEYVGVGITVTPVDVQIAGEKLSILEIYEVLDDSPASDAGVQEGDYVTYVRVDRKWVSVDEIGYEAANAAIAAKEDGYLKFKVMRYNDQDRSYTEHEFSLLPREINRVTAKGEICTTDSKVGIVTITEFDFSTPKYFCDAVDSLKAQGCKYFVIDLRGNPGGYAESICAILTYFLDHGDVIMTTEDRDGNVVDKNTAGAMKNEYFELKRDEIGKYKDLEICLLVNGNTASAAELFTHTVRDYQLGSIVGTKTYGKGCLQQTYDLSYYGIPGGLRLTTHYYFSQSHTSYHGVGILPDVTVELSDEAKEYKKDIPHEIDNQLREAIDQLKK